MDELSVSLSIHFCVQYLCLCYNKDFKFNAFYIQLNIILYTIGRNFRLLGGILWGKHL